MGMKKIYVFDNGTFIECFENVQKASEFLKIKAHTIRVCKNRKSLAFGRYFFTNNKDERPPTKQSIYAWKINGDFVGEFSSIKKTSVALGIEKSLIAKTLRGGYKQTHGLVFSKDNTFPADKVKTTMIYVWDNGTLYLSGRSTREIADALELHINTVTKAIKNKKLIYNRYFFTYDENELPPAPKVRQTCKDVKTTMVYMWENGTYIGCFDGVTRIATTINASIYTIYANLSKKTLAFNRYFFSFDKDATPPAKKVKKDKVARLPKTPKPPKPTIYIWKSGVLVAQCSSRKEAAEIIGCHPNSVAGVVLGYQSSVYGFWATYDENKLPPSRTTNELLEVEHEILTHYAEKFGLNNVFELLDLIKKNSTKITAENYEYENRIELQDIYGDDQNFITNDEDYWHKYLCGKWHV